MKKDVKLHWGFILSIISFALSVVTMIIFFIKVTPNSVVDSNTFIGAIAAFIGIAVTLVIGFQIYSIIDIKSKMADIDSLKEYIESTNSELTNTKETLSILEIELKGKIKYAEAITNMNLNHHYEAFLDLHYAIVHFAGLESEKEELPNYIKMLKAYADTISKEDFELDFYIDYFLLMAKDIHLKLINRNFYWVIKNDYETIYKDVTRKVLSFKQA